jgi:DNA-binding PadR family transcriptional regulator
MDIYKVLSESAIEKGALMAEANSRSIKNIPLTPAVFNILLALSDGEKHGYAIMLEVEHNTEGEVKMGPGTLYGSIKRMLEAGLIEESGERPDPQLDDQRRRYYRMTGAGQRALGAEAGRLSRQVAVARLKQILEYAA